MLKQPVVLKTPYDYEYTLPRFFSFTNRRGRIWLTPLTKIEVTKQMEPYDNGQILASFDLVMYRSLHSTFACAL